MVWTAAIIAGGSASRLGGRDKSRLPVGTQSILDRQLAVLRPLTGRMLIVANEPERFRHLGLPVAGDLVPGAAALGGVYTALAMATTEHVLAIACDLPFVSAAFLRHVVAAPGGVDLVIPRSSDGLQPMCALYSRACLEPIRGLLAAGDLRVQALAAVVRTREIGPDEIAAYDPDGLLFFNVNTPADYARALEIAARLEAGQEPPDRITRVPLRRLQHK